MPTEAFLLAQARIQDFVCRLQAEREPLHHGDPVGEPAPWVPLTALGFCRPRVGSSDGGGSSTASLEGPTARGAGFGSCSASTASTEFSPCFRHFGKTKTSEPCVPHLGWTTNYDHSSNAACGRNPRIAPDAVCLPDGNARQAAPKWHCDELEQAQESKPHVEMLSNTTCHGPRIAVSPLLLAMRNKGSSLLANMAVESKPDTAAMGHEVLCVPAAPPGLSYPRYEMNSRKINSAYGVRRGFVNGFPGALTATDPNFPMWTDTMYSI